CPNRVLDSAAASLNCAARLRGMADSDSTTEGGEGPFADPSDARRKIEPIRVGKAHAGRRSTGTANCPRLRCLRPQVWAGQTLAAPPRESIQAACDSWRPVATVLGIRPLVDLVRCPAATLSVKVDVSDAVIFPPAGLC